MKWREAVHIRDLVERPRTWNPTKAAHGERFLYIDLAAVNHESKRVDTAREVACTDAPSRARQLVAEGDVLVATVRPNLNAVALVPRELDAATASTGFCVLRPSPTKLDSGYLFHWVRTPVFVAAMVKQATGASYPAVSDRTVLSSAIPLPSLAEQRGIAESLDQADALRIKRRRALSELNDLSQVIFRDLFGDPDGMLGRWPTTKLGDVLDFLTSGSRGWAAHYADSGALFLRIQNVRRDELLLDDVAYVNPPSTAEAKRTRVQPGDVLMSITADLGRTAVVPEGIGTAFINQHLSILRTRTLVPAFLSGYLASPVGQRQVSRRNRQGVKAGLNFDDIRSLVVPLPPMEVQLAFASCGAAVQRMKTAHRASLAELDRLFASLQHRAFPGEAAA